MKGRLQRCPGRPQEPRGGYLRMVRDTEMTVSGDQRYVPFQGIYKCLDHRDTRTGSQDVIKQEELSVLVRDERRRLCSLAPLFWTRDHFMSSSLLLRSPWRRGAGGGYHGSWPRPLLQEELPSQGPHEDTSAPGRGEPSEFPGGPPVPLSLPCSASQQPPTRGCVPAA